MTEGMLVARVLLGGMLPEVVDEAAVQLVLVEELVSLVHYLLVAAASQGFGLLRHAGVVVLLALRLRMCVDVDAERLMAHHFVGGLVTVAGIVVEEIGQHLAALDFPCVKVHGLTDITHSCSL